MTAAGTPDVSVIIPTYNRSASLPAAVDSVLGQVHQSLELIVVDDGSTDGTSAYLSSIDDERVRWCRLSRQRGANAARNEAAKLARADLLSFLDSDDIYHAHRLSDVIPLFETHPELPAHISSFVFRGRSSRLSSNPDVILQPIELEAFLIAKCISVGGAGISIRRSVFHEIGGFDESLLRGQDHDILLRLARTHGCAMTSRPNWTKNLSPDSISASSQGVITALNELCRRHPVIEQRYADLYRYRVAREIVRPTIRFQFGRAAGAWREAAAEPRSRSTLFNLPRHYFAGRRERRRRWEVLAAMGSRANDRLQEG